jgi:hypothetical protein
VCPRVDLVCGLVLDATVINDLKTRVCCFPCFGKCRAVLGRSPEHFKAFAASMLLPRWSLA